MKTSLKNEALFWKKKEFVSFVLSVFVFFIHISSIAQYTDGGSFISLVNDKFGFFFKRSITGFAVPMFFILSGVSFFKGYDNKKYYGKIKSRIFTLAVPYLVWNTLWMLFEIFCSYSFVSKFFVGRVPFSLTFTNILKGVFFYECNGPFWFVFDLIVFSVAAPLLYLVIRNKYVGITSVILLTVLSPFGIQIPQSVFYSSNSIIFYLIGAIIGKHYFDFASRKSSKRMQCFSALFFAVYVALKNIFGIQTNALTPLLQIIVLLFAAFALWNITDIIVDKIQPKGIYSRSFAIYAMHINVSAIITKLIYLCLPKSEWLAIPNFVVTVVLTLLSINLFCAFSERFCPRIYSVLMGRRLR